MRKPKLKEFEVEVCVGLWARVTVKAESLEQALDLGRKEVKSVNVTDGVAIERKVGEAKARRVEVDHIDTYFSVNGVVEKRGPEKVGL